MSNSAHRGKPRRRPAVIALISLVSVVGIGTAAYAYWTTTGGGSGSATTGEAEELIVEQTSVIEDLYPGIAAIELTGTITNPGDSAVTVETITGAVTAVRDADDAIIPGCATSNYQVNGTATLSSANVPGNSSSVTWDDLELTMLNTSSNQDACKNATITITYTVVPAS